MCNGGMLFLPRYIIPTYIVIATYIVVDIVITIYYYGDITTTNDQLIIYRNDNVRRGGNMCYNDNIYYIIEPHIVIAIYVIVTIAP